MILLAIAGPKKHGKTTLARCIQEQLNTEHCYLVNFADALKKEVAELLKVSLDDIEASKDTFRPMLQWYGTEFRRFYCKEPDYWIKRWAYTITKKIDNSIILCSDCRFNDEAFFIKEIGGHIAHVFDRNAPRTIDTHISEAGIKDEYIDTRILNDSSLGISILQNHAAQLIKKYNLNKYNTKHNNT